jgi:glycerate 2-kinase
MPASPPTILAMTGMLRIILAPDSFKGTLSAGEVCATLAEAAAHYLPDAELVRLPLSDGGEGLVDALVDASGGERIQSATTDPLGRPLAAVYGILPDGTAVIEMAAASGLPLLKPAERNPMLTSTCGTGLLIADALHRGCRKFILGLGGSATVDGGIGAAEALGYRFLGDDGLVAPNGAGLANIRRLELSGMLPALREALFCIACDVTSPLCGPQGAAAVFGPQKGATPAMVQALDAGLANLAAVLRRDHHLETQDVPGLGAAGGLAVPFLLLAQTTLRSGLDIVLEQLDFERHLADCDLVITGEGRTDEQSAMGKVLSGVARRARAAGKPAIAISGAVEPGSEKLYEQGITALLACVRRVTTLPEALASAKPNLYATACDLFRLLAALDRRQAR